jgi:hypothetical protein
MTGISNRTCLSSSHPHSFHHNHHNCETVRG